MEDKLRTLRIYAEELGEPPFPRSLEHVRALAANRGAVAGCQYAEAFMILREMRSSQNTQYQMEKAALRNYGAHASQIDLKKHFYDIDF